MSWGPITLWLAAALLLAAAAVSVTAAVSKSEGRKRPLSLTSAALAAIGLVLIVISQIVDRQGPHPPDRRPRAPCANPPATVRWLTSANRRWTNWDAGPQIRLLRASRSWCRIGGLTRARAVHRRAAGGGDAASVADSSAGAAYVCDEVARLGQDGGRLGGVGLDMGVHGDVRDELAVAVAGQGDRSCRGAEQVLVRA